GTACGGVAIIVPHHVPVQQLSLTTSLQAVAVRLSLNVLLTICCVYLPPGIDVSVTTLEGLINQLPSPLLLLGDFNAHNPLWGGGCLDTMGRHVADLLSSCHLCMFNTGADTYFHQPTRTFSAIDLSLGSPSVFPDWSWKVLDDLSGSDHFPVLLSYTGDGMHPTSRPSRWVLDRASWPLFTSSAVLTHDMV
ncbi:hypothetical protein JGG47_23765, partial [Salmonella enterica subsp. enterica serovar Derby]|nr:hypothetical protein [Salmonella enterica subsp. enterica serovar Derby]